MTVLCEIGLGNEKPEVSSLNIIVQTVCKEMKNFLNVLVLIYQFIFSL